MIRIRKKARAPVPGILKTKGKQEIKALQLRYDRGERDFSGKDFKSSIYSNKDVKDALIAIQNYKCCFCESKIGHTSYGDVEHFRPKVGWVQKNEKINKPGYYWLAYHWDNLLLSCQICNQRNKKNYFPLLNNSHRALSHHNDVDDEKPVFIHPANEEAEAFITFREEIPVSINSNVRGIETISKLGLDRELLNERRRDLFNMITTIYDLAKGYPDTFPELKQEARNTVLNFFDKSQSDETEYASMLRAFFKDNSVNF